jgi:hypothetical protein
MTCAETRRWLSRPSLFINAELMRATCVSKRSVQPVTYMCLLRFLEFNENTSNLESREDVLSIHKHYENIEELEAGDYFCLVKLFWDCVQHVHVISDGL